MTATREGLPEGRYGRSADERSDRTLKIVGAVLGAVFLGVIAWIGISYVSGQTVSGELIKFKVVSDETVEGHLEVRKDAGAPGVCTVRALASGDVVGRKDVRFEQKQGRLDAIVTVRTTERADALELVGCKPATES
ncbi:DUF4307 domain-containing protein [Streptomyces sp. TP-A0874]|uniref:DUF4307 domain-containing protein n=1 Tax=Streptomyces sp. TP-A0874 TaxID=549819 RepID=UPI000852DFE2|nr:DUF4307 domain-containing protein [Streptomyces sp. TP-A0874]